MNPFYTDLFKELEMGHDLCLATIIRQVGSAPRSLGTRFFVRKDGSFHGTIGGGRLEADVIRKCRQSLTSGESSLELFRLRGTDVAETDMLCGGDVDVFVEPVYAQDSDARELFGAAVKVGARGGRALMVTPVFSGPVCELEERRILLVEGKEPLGAIHSLPGFADELLRDFDRCFEQSGLLLRSVTSPDGSMVDCFIEPIISQPVVYLFGGGHISLHLARLIKMVGFKLVVMDDRREYANPDRFPEADGIWTRDYNGVLDESELGPDAYVVIVTRGHLYDKEVLAQALRKETAYVGMIGSRRKRSLIYRALEEEGFSPEQLSSVHAPIGLDIGAETPEEIAVSIVAELIAVRARKTTPLSLNASN
ncbi:MAG: XdhC family protein [Deltaproteobacteria bacterium]|nr:XdhC family protein [Deltaproteobacteria bacterium]